MKNPIDSLTKTCSICGIEKSLEEFSQSAGLRGSVIYGTICADCRKKNIDRLAGEEAAGGIKGRTEKTLDTKAKVKIEADKKEQKKAREDSFLQEHEKETKRSQEKYEKSSKIDKEQKIREGILAKSSVLSTRKSETTEKKAGKFSSETLSTEATEQLEKSTAQDQQLKTHNPQAAFQPSQTGAQVKFQGVYKQFLDWLGQDSPAAKAAKSAEGKKQLESHSAKETVSDYIRKAWKK